MAIASRPQQLTLSNGIPVILQHQDGPVAATYWWVRTGSADEAPKEEGFAHFLEHMLFKDAAAKETGKASSGAMARAIESLGGEINAYTSFDQTVYHVNCAAHHWEKVIDVFGAMAEPQKFLKSDFEREREVILEELRKNNDSPSRQLFQTLYSATYSRHPYGRPVIGFPKTLKAATVGQLESFYRRNYASSNMGLVLVGPVGAPEDPRRARILKTLEKRFGRGVIPKRPHSRAKRVVEKELRERPELLVRKFDVKTPTIAFSFRVPGLQHEDMPALDLMSGILGQGELSRIYQSLFYKLSLATEASGGIYVPRDPGMIYFYAELAELGKVLPAAEAILAELARMRETLVTEEELSRMRVNAESDRLYATQTADGMAARLGHLRYVLDDLEYDEVYLEQLRAVDARMLRETARKYLDWKRMSFVLLMPEKDPAPSRLAGEAPPEPSLEPILEAARKQLPSVGSAELKRSRASSARRGEPRFVDLPSGLRVVHLEKAASHVVSVHAAALGGLRLEQAKDWGVSTMMSLTWTKGTRNRDARAIATAIEGRAASMDAFGGRNSVGMTLTGLARDWNSLSEIFNESLLEPSFPDAEVEHSRRVAEDSIRSIEDQTSQVCSKLFLETLFERHPYGRLATGSLETLAAISSEKLKRYHSEWLRPDRLTVAVVGAVRAAQVDSWIERLDRELTSRAKDPRPAPGVASEAPLKAPRWIERALGREQTHILVGGLGLTVNSPDRFAVRILETLLGGQSGRLFIELREKRSLAYTVAPVSVEGIEPGYLATYIACAPGKRQEAVDGIRRVLEALATKGPTPAEMRRAREYYLGQRAMDLQSDSSVASHYSLQRMYGVPPLSEAEVSAIMAKVTARDVQRVCRKYLVEPPVVTAVVG